MHNSRSSSVEEHALGVIQLERPLVDAVNRRDRDLASWFFNHSSASQLRRVLSSISLNLAEGFGCSSGNQRLRFETALGSLKEAQAAIRIAVPWGYFSQSAAAETVASLHTLGGRVFGLVRR